MKPFRLVATLILLIGAAYQVAALRADDLRHPIPDNYIDVPEIMARFDSKAARVSCETSLEDVRRLLSRRPEEDASTDSSRGAKGLVGFASIWSKQFKTPGVACAEAPPTAAILIYGDAPGWGDAELWKSLEVYTVHYNRAKVSAGLLAEAKCSVASYIPASGVMFRGTIVPGWKAGDPLPDCPTD